MYIFSIPFTLIGFNHVINWFDVQRMGPTSLTWRAYNDVGGQVLQLSPSIIYICCSTNWNPVGSVILLVQIRIPISTGRNWNSDLYWI